MNKPALSVTLTLLFCASCSNYQGKDWQPGDAIYPASPQGRIHGDERSQSERYHQCLSASEKTNNKAARSRCLGQSLQPDPDYIGVTLPLYF